MIEAYLSNARQRETADRLSVFGRVREMGSADGSASMFSKLPVKGSILLRRER